MEPPNYAVPNGMGIGLQIETTTWRTGAAMGGLFANLPLGRTHSFEVGIKGLVGIQYTLSPKLNMRMSGNGVVVTGRQESVSTSSFSYLVGVQYKYHFNRTLGLVLSVDFNSSEAKFDHVTGMVGGTKVDVESKQVLSSTDISLGLVIAF